MKRFPVMLVLVCVLLYSWQALGPWARKVDSAGHARDFASFYYAVHAAAQGRNPYIKRNLIRLSREQGTRRSVHPYFYPPPFLLAFLWVLPLGLSTAFKAWYMADHFLLLLAMLALWRWMAGGWVRGAPAALALGVMAFSFSPVADNDWMGQVNLLVLAATAWGLYLAEHKKKCIPGGALLGLACMFKMSPALLVMWWLLRKKWKPALVACLAGLLLSVLSLPLVGLDEQLYFYIHVLPGFGSGSYNGLTVPITLPANHSIPSLLHEIFPDAAATASRTRLSTTARGLSRLIALVLMAFTAWRFRRPAPDSLASLCQAGTIVVLMLVLPVYTYEHHMVWMLIPYAAAFAAVAQRRLSLAWLPLLVLAYLFQALPLTWLKVVYSWLDNLGDARDLLYYPLREAKFVAALLLGLACAVAGGRLPANRGSGR